MEIASREEIPKVAWSTVRDDHSPKVDGSIIVVAEAWEDVSQWWIEDGLSPGVLEGGG